MDFPDNFEIPLKAMLYGALGSHPLTKDVNRVIWILVNGWLYKLPTACHLGSINRLLDYHGSLEPVSEQNEYDDSEIREFLEALARAIEKGYPHALRSRSSATEAGKWMCMNYPGKEALYKKGDLLPDIDGQRVVWEYKPDLSNLSSEDLIKREFQTYYSTKVVGTSIRYKGPEKFIPFSIARFVGNIESHKLAEMVHLFQAMGFNRQHPLTKDIEKLADYDWTTHEEDWQWFQKLMIDMAKRLAQEI